MKKSLIDISWKVDEATYRKGEGYSYSTLAKFQREGFRKIKYLFEKVESPSLVFGGLVDTLLTGTQEEVDEKYFIADFPSLSDSLEKIVNALYRKTGGHFLTLKDIPEEVIHEVAINENYYSAEKWKNLRLKNILEGCSDYYDLLRLAGEKTLVSQEIFNKAILSKEELKSNSYTRFFFARDNGIDGIERIYQAKFKADYNGIPIRCMSDLIVVDHINKTVTPVDLKTSFHYEEDFEKSFTDWRYMIQAQLYAYIIKQNMLQDAYFKDFILLDYRFIVINKETRTPLVWLFPHTFVEEDCVNNETGEVYPNWRKILGRLEYYLKNNPIYPLEISELNTITRISPVQKLDNIKRQI